MSCCSGPFRQAWNACDTRAAPPLLLDFCSCWVQGTLLLFDSAAVNELLQQAILVNPRSWHFSCGALFAGLQHPKVPGPLPGCCPDC